MSGQAQESPRIRNFSPNDYGGQNQNWSLAQSPEGWLWAGNNGSLLEFDGARWRALDLPNRQTVRAVAIGPGDLVFCGGFAEFGYWKTDATGQRIYTSLSRQVSSKRLGKEEIWHIFQGQGHVFFQSFSALYKYDFQSVTELSPPGAVMFGTEVGGQIWVPVIGKGLYELRDDGTFQLVPGTEVLKDKIVQFLVPNGVGGVWAGTTNSGIFEVQGGQCRAWVSPLNEVFKKHQLNKAVLLRDGGWAIGTILGGVYILDKTGRLRFHLDRSNGLQNNTVLAMTEDREGNLWVGLDRGIDFVQIKSPLIFFSDQTGNIGTVYTAAHWKGRLYIGTNQGVFSRPDTGTPIQGKALMTAGQFKLVEGSQGQVWQLKVFGDQLLCGHNGGTFVIENNTAQKVSEVTGGWHTTFVPGRSDLLVQSTYTGLVLFKRRKEGGWGFNGRVSGFQEPLKRIAFDPQGYLWGSHPSRGLLRLRLSADFSTVLGVQTFSEADGLPTDYQLDLTQMDDDVFVNVAPVALRVQTKGDSAYFEAFEAKWQVRKWLPVNGCRFALDSSGLCAWADQQRYDLPLNLVPTYENVVALDDTTYLFCLENGYALLNRHRLSELRPRSSAMAPVIHLIEASDGVSVAAAQGLRFSYDQNSLTFRFSVPFFEHAPRFSWYLDGFSEGWSAWQTSPEREFTNLPSGRYTFRLRTDVGPEEATLSFEIAPPWYRSFAAMIGYFLVIIGLLWQLEQYNRRRLDRQLQRLEAEKAAELARQRTEAEHEKLLLEVNNQSRELSNAAFNLIRKNEVLQGLKDDLQDLKNDPAAVRKIIRHIDEHIESDHDWAIFEESFNRVHDDFFKRLMHDFPELTPGDLRLAAYLKMNLSSKEIAPLLNISVRGVENKRYRLRKKLGLSEEANLTEFILSFT